MKNHTTEKTRSLLVARGDIELINDALIELEIESDGVAWIRVLDVDVDVCYRPDDDAWIVVAPGFPRFADLGDAMRVALIADAERDQRTPAERILSWVFEELPGADGQPDTEEKEEGKS